MQLLTCTPDQAIRDLIQGSAVRRRETVVAGDLALDRLYAKLSRMKLDKAKRYVYFALDPNGPASIAKRRLLQKSYSKVQFIVGLDIASGAMQESLRTMVDGSVIGIPRRRPA